MEAMYQAYKDIAEFRLVYINEAHATDSNRPVAYAFDLNIRTHMSFGERCATADMMLKDKDLSIPIIVDGMDNKVNAAYHAWPDRVYVIRTDGRLAVAGDRGPRGFAPAIDETEQWLARYKATGQEPPLQLMSDEMAAAVGEWDMRINFRGQTFDAKVSIGVGDDGLLGRWASQERVSKLTNIEINGQKLSFLREFGEGRGMTYEGMMREDRIYGQFVGPFGAMICDGEKTSDIARVFEQTVAEPDSDILDADTAETVNFNHVVGRWQMTTSFQGQEIEAAMSITSTDEGLSGTWESMGMEMNLSNVAYDGAILSFTRAMGQGGPSLSFEGTVVDNTIDGVYKTEFGELKCTGKRDDL